MVELPVRAEVNAATKPARIHPNVYRNKDGHESPGIISRFRKIRARYLEATAFFVSGEVPAREPFDCLFPPYEPTWLEWSEGHYDVGAYVFTIGPRSRLVVEVVINGPEVITFYDQSESMYVDDQGRTLGPTESAARLLGRRMKHERRAYERVCDVLARLNSPTAEREISGRSIRFGPQIAAESELIERVTIDVRALRYPPATHSESPSGPIRPLHQVRGHPRRYKSGKVVWISDHTRGDPRNGTHISDYKLESDGGSEEDLRRQR